MTLPSNQTTSMATLGIAKVSFGALLIFRRHLGDDLELALIGCAAVLRTRRDVFDLARNDLITQKSFEEAVNERGFYTSTNEISQFTQINRITVSRKMKRLVELGFLERTQSDRWHCKDCQSNDNERPRALLQELLRHYITHIQRLNDFVSATHLEKIYDPVTVRGLAEISALSDDEVKRKRKRRLELPLLP